MKRPPLANAELAVMNLLWTEPSMTARALRETLYPDSDKAQHGTVQRLLQRLEQKGFVKRDRTLTIHVFTAAVSRDNYAANQLESLADKLTGGSVAPLITHLLEAKSISQEEIDAIRRMLDQKEQRDG